MELRERVARALARCNGSSADYSDWLRDGDADAAITEVRAYDAEMAGQAAGKPAAADEEAWRVAQLAVMLRRPVACDDFETWPPWDKSEALVVQRARLILAEARRQCVKG